MPFQKGNKLQLKFHSKSTKKKISKARLGKHYPKLSAAFSGKNHPRFGKPHSEETKRKLRLSNKGKVHSKVAGANHPNWKGGSLSYLKRQVKVRDDYTCMICGFREPEIMQVDHIQPRAVYPELNLVLNNLMTICPNCNARKTIKEKRSKIFIKVGKNQFRK